LLRVRQVVRGSQRAGQSNIPIAFGLSGFRIRADGCWRCGILLRVRAAPSHGKI